MTTSSDKTEGYCSAPKSKRGPKPDLEAHQQMNQGLLPYFLSREPLDALRVGINSSGFGKFLHDRYDRCSTPDCKSHPQKSDASPQRLADLRHVFPPIRDADRNPNPLWTDPKRVQNLTKSSPTTPNVKLIQEVFQGIETTMLELRVSAANRALIEQLAGRVKELGWEAAVKETAAETFKRLGGQSREARLRRLMLPWKGVVDSHPTRRQTEDVTKLRAHYERTWTEALEAIGRPITERGGVRSLLRGLEVLEDGHHRSYLATNSDRVVAAFASAAFLLIDGSTSPTIPR